MIKRRKFSLGILTKPTTTAATLEGELYANSSSLTFKVYIDGAERDLVTADQSQTLTNKTLDADNNTVSNLETDNLKAGVLNTDLSGAATDTELPSALAVKTALAGQNEASEITYDNSTSGLTATDLQAAVDEVEGRLDTAETSIGNNATAVSDHLSDATDAHDASAISNVAAGNLAATDVQGALNELQSDIDNRALDSDLTDHLNDAADAHDASAISNVPAGNLVATDVQAALDELQTELDDAVSSSDLTAHEGDTSTHGVATIAGLTESQTLTNKTLTSPDINTPDIDGGTASNTSRLLLPQDTTTNLDLLTDTESLLAYDTTLKKPVFNDGSGWEAIGTGSGSGINYILNSDAEVDTTGWQTYDNGAVTVPTDGISGSATSNFNRNTTTPLRGAGDFVFEKAISNGQGEGFSYDFTIDSADQAKKLTISFDYDASDVNYKDDEMAVFIYDVTNTSIIRVNGEDLKAGKGTHYAQFQTAPDSVSYRLIVHQVGALTTGPDIYFDNFKVGPTNLAFGTPTIDDKSYTPTTQGLGSPSNIEVFYSRVGDKLQLRGNLTSGTTTGDEVQIGLPSGLTIDSTKVPSIQAAGSWFKDLTTTLNGGSVLITGGDNYINLSATTVFAASSTNALSPSIGTNVDSGSNPISFYAELPIEGWSSNVRQSEDLGGRDVVVRGLGNSGESVTANVTNVPFSEIEDTTASYDGTSFTVPESGYYTVMGSIVYTAAQTNPNITCYINATQDLRLSSEVASTSTLTFAGRVKLVKGDILTIRQSETATLRSDIPTLHWIHIQKESSPQTMLETEKVCASYSSDSGQTVTTLNDYAFEDLEVDTHNAYNTSTGEYTILITGFYIICASIQNNSAQSIQLTVQVNGSDSFKAVNAASDQSSTTASKTISLVKGDIITVQNSNGGSRTLSTDSSVNYFSIIKN